MSKYHGTRHLKGSVEINENEISENAIYWTRYANGAKLALVKKVGEVAANNLLSPFWNDEYTWKEICLRTEKILDLGAK